MSCRACKYFACETAIIYPFLFVYPIRRPLRPSDEWQLLRLLWMGHRVISEVVKPDKTDVPELGMVFHKWICPVGLTWDHDIYPSYSEDQDEGNSSLRMAAYPQRTAIAIYGDQIPNVAPNTMLWQRLLSEAKSQTKLSLSSSSTPQFSTPQTIWITYLFLCTLSTVATHTHPRPYPDPAYAHPGNDHSTLGLASVSWNQSSCNGSVSNHHERCRVRLRSPRLLYLPRFGRLIWSWWA